MSRDAGFAITAKPAKLISPSNCAAKPLLFFFYLERRFVISDSWEWLSQINSRVFPRVIN
jgi:hypothetical protein